MITSLGVSPCLAQGACAEYGELILAKGTVALYRLRIFFILMPGFSPALPQFPKKEPGIRESTVIHLNLTKTPESQTTHRNEYNWPRIEMFQTVPIDTNHIAGSIMRCPGTIGAGLINSSTTMFA